MAKKSRRKRAVQRKHQVPQVEGTVMPPPQPLQTAPVAQAPAQPARPTTVKAPAAMQPVLRSTDTSHNLRLELFMITALGGGAIAVLLGLALINPTDAVAKLLHL